jgi:DNA-binding winged helix-turn-helix (wHTH) protein/tetratricopeptide (TPR) repeat protein
MSLENSPSFLLNFSECEMNGEEKHFYQFKSFRLDVEERQLLHDNSSVPLTPKAFDVLAVLVERGGHLVEKDELLRIVWADSFVEEANVSRIVHTLRKVLGDDGNGNKFIETVAKKGYRFVARVDEVRETARTSENENQNLPVVEKLFDNELLSARSLVNEIDVSPANKRKHTTRIILIAVGFLSVISLISLLAFSRQSTSAINSNVPKSIAVLPIKPINVENRDLIYELGIADSLINKLVSAKGLTVRPLSATRKYTDIEQDAIAVGREQQVDYVLASNYQIADGKIRVTAQFINVQTGVIEETLRSDKDNTDKLSMQDAIANDFGNLLLKQLGKTEDSQTAKRGTNNEEAYRLYLKAEYIFAEFNDAEIGNAIEYLEQAVKLDPNYAQAYVELAYAYQHYQWIWSKNIPSEKEYYLKSKQAIEKALALDENSADAHAVSGFIKSGSEHDFAGAEKEYRRAIELNSDSGMAHGLYAGYLSNAGSFDEALAERKKAIEIYPASVVDQITYGMILYDAHRYPEAYAHYKKMLEKNENSYYPYFWLWVVSDAQGNEAEAYEWFIKYQTQMKTDPETMRLYQTAYQKSGYKGLLREIIKQDEKTIKLDNNPDLLYEVACFNAKLGDKDKAFENLDRAYERRRSSLNFIKVDPSLDSLQDDPRFDELVRRVGLK